MKSFIKKRLSIIKVICFTFSLPLFSNAQSVREIKDFNKSFTFTNTYQIDMINHIYSDTISDINSVAKFSIDKYGKGTIDFTAKGLKSTLVTVDYSLIKLSNQKIDLNFGCTHSERPEKIQMTIGIDPESYQIKNFVILNEAKEIAYFFY
jgi:hypothetical protein